jgi:hypothetical protein
VSPPGAPSGLAPSEWQARIDRLARRGAARGARPPAWPNPSGVHRHRWVWRHSSGVHRRRSAWPEPVAWILGTALPGLVVLAGAALRLEQFAVHRSFWPDEAMLAYNVVHRGFLGLLHPLAFQQGAPVAFLWAERASVVVLGNNEYALTLVPLLAGLASLVLVWLVACRLLSPVATVAALALVSFSPSLIFYSTEAKQYAVDAACTLAVVLLGIRLLGPGPPFSQRRLCGFAVGSALLLWLSHATVLVAGAMAGLIVVRALIGRRRRDVLLTLAAGAVVGLSLGVDFVVSLRHLSRDTYLLAYWVQGFVPHPVTPGSVLRWLVRTVPALVTNPAGLAFAGLGAVLAVIGSAVLIWRRGWEALALLAVPAAAVVGAVSGKYPVKGRLALFAVPVLMVALAATIDAGLVAWGPARRQDGASSGRRGSGRGGSGRGGSGRWGSGRWGSDPAALAVGGSGRGARLALRVAAAGLVAALLAQPLAGAAAEVVRPIHVSEVRPVLQFVEAHWRPGDVVDLDAGAADVWSYYATELGLRVPAYAVLPAAEGGSCATPRVLVPPGGAKRVWLVFGYHLSFAPSDEHQVYLSHFAAIGRLVLHHRADKASAYLFDLFGARSGSAAGRAPGGARPGRPLLTAPGVRCLRVVPEAPLSPTGLRTGPFGTGRLS